MEWHHRQEKVIIAISEKLLIMTPMSNVKIYTTDYCPFCTAAKNLLKGKGIPYEEIPIENFVDKDKLMDKTGHPTVPQIFIDDEFIGGFEELRRLEESGELNQKLGI